MTSSSPLRAGFQPIATPQAKLIILGSMPGDASLQAQQYYAHPRNAFWPLLSDFFQLPHSTPYAEKLQQLNLAGIALWDVLAQCQRQGSLDSRIHQASAIPNPFNDFFAQHPAIKVILFNGTTAEKLFRRHVLPTLNTSFTYYSLPSTSPAHAALSFDAKKHLWHTALTQALTH